MAMSKKEAAEMEALREALRLATTQAESGLQPPVMIPPPKDGYVNGWVFYWSRGEGRVEEAWSEASLHGSGHRVDNSYQRIASQGGIPLYATKYDAYIAMRLQAEKLCIGYLAAIDLKIEATRPDAPKPQAVVKKSPGFRP